MARGNPTFRSILVPLDASAFAEQALPVATSIAQRDGGKMRLMLVHELPPRPRDRAAEKMCISIELATRKAERAYLRGVQAKLRDSGAAVTSAVTLTGAPGPALAGYARQMSIDLVVMATHGRGGVQRAWLGSVADHLIRNLEIPVLLVRPGEGAGISKQPAGTGQILVPLDGSSLAEEALEPATALARIWDAPLTLLQVIRPVQLADDLAFPFPSAYDEELTSLWRDQSQDYLNDLVETLKEQGLRAAGAAMIGWSSVNTILEAAPPASTAAIVIATHGRGGLKRVALGSVADKVVRGADVPVLVYRPGGRARPGKQSPRGARSRARAGKAGR